MCANIDNENVQYVEYLEGDYGDDQEVITIDGENLQQVEYIEAQQLSAEVKYNEEGYPQLEGHTVFEHNGRQYMIPNELHQSGQTIVLEDYNADDEQQQQNQQQLDEDAVNTIELNDEDSQVNSELSYLEYKGGEWGECENPSDYVVTGTTEDDGAETEGRQFAVLRDGRLHTSAESPGDCEEPETEPETRQFAVLRDGRFHVEGPGAQDKLQQLQQSLGLDDTDNDMDQDENQTEELPQPDVTGKNLITGQTISLSGFLQKLKRKGDILNFNKEISDDNYYPDSIKKQRRSFYNQGRTDRRFSEISRPDYVLMPPINKKVLVGKTSDGKNIVGKILQIWKKVDNTLPAPKPRTIKKKAKIIKTERPKDNIEELIIDSTGKIISPNEMVKKNVIIKKKYVSKQFLDENIVKTLSGLMELDSIQKNLARKNLVIKHILKKSLEGKIVPGKEITYFYGHMEKSEIIDCFNEVKNQWTFVSDYQEVSPGAIDLNESNDRQQVELGADGKITFGTMTEPDLNEICSSSEGERKVKRVSEFTETVPINLIVVEDEYGKKSTKVTIPQLVGKKEKPRHTSEEPITTSDHICTVCNRSFSSLGALRRHLASHSPNTPYQSTLTEHTTQQVSSRRFVCATCGKQFNRHSNMLRHADIHTGLTPHAGYTCHVCGCHYNFISSLTRHIVNNHMHAINQGNATAQMHNDSTESHNGQEDYELVELREENYELVEGNDSLGNDNGQMEHPES